jgi:hypothetical protein
MAFACLYFSRTDDLKMFISTLSNSILLDEIENEKILSGKFAIKELESAKRFYNATILDILVDVT